MTAVAESLAKEGGQQAANLKVAEQYVNAFAYLAKTNNTLIVPRQHGRHGHADHLGHDHARPNQSGPGQARLNRLTRRVAPRRPWRG